MASFDPANPVYPQGCYLVPTTDEMCFWEPNFDGKQEIDFNKYTYYVETESKQLLRVKDEVLRDIFHSPESPWEDKPKGMVMLSPKDIKKPSHIPNLFDIVGRINVNEVFVKLHNFNFEFPRSSNTKLIPKFLQGFVDPEPILDFNGPVYALDDNRLKTEMGCYTDGLQIFYMFSPLTHIEFSVAIGRSDSHTCDRYSQVTLMPEIKEGELAFDLGSTCILWNARGVTRPSFESNFKKMMDIHNPVVVIVTEVRVSEINFEKLAGNLGEHLGWNIDESVGLKEGLVWLWDKRRAEEDEVLVAGSATCPLRVVASIKAKAAVVTAPTGGEMEVDSTQKAVEEVGSTLNVEVN